MFYSIGGPVRIGEFGMGQIDSMPICASSLSADALTTMVNWVLTETRLAGSKVSQLEWGDNFYLFMKKVS